jgi:hypothetical protein
MCRILLQPIYRWHDIKHEYIKSIASFPMIKNTWGYLYWSRFGVPVLGFPWEAATVTVDQHLISGINRPLIIYARIFETLIKWKRLKVQTEWKLKLPSYRQIQLLQRFSLEQLGQGPHLNVFMCVKVHIGRCIPEGLL